MKELKKIFFQYQFYHKHCVTEVFKKTVNQLCYLSNCL